MSTFRDDSSLHRAIGWRTPALVLGSTRAIGVASLAIAVMGPPAAGQTRDLPLNDRRSLVYAAQSPMTIDDRMVLLGLMEGMASSYLDELSRVTYQTFDRLSIDASMTAALSAHVEDAHLMMNIVLRDIQALRRQPSDRRGWLLLTRNFNSITDRLADLDRFEVVESQRYIVLRTLMRSVFDKILLPDFG